MEGVWLYLIIDSFSFKAAGAVVVYASVFAHGIKKIEQTTPQEANISGYCTHLQPLGRHRQWIQRRHSSAKLCKQSDRRNQTPGCHLLHNGCRASWSDKLSCHWRQRWFTWNQAGIWSWSPISAPAGGWHGVTLQIENHFVSLTTSPFSRSLPRPRYPGCRLTAAWNVTLISELNTRQQITGTTLAHISGHNKLPARAILWWNMYMYITKTLVQIWLAALDTTQTPGKGPS